MDNDEIQWPLERFLGGLDELKAVLGTEVAPTLGRVKEELIAAIAARDRGDRDGALVNLSRGMAALADLGDRLGGAEGAMMRTVTAAFITGLARTDQELIERNLKLIQAQAGTPTKER